MSAILITDQAITGTRHSFEMTTGKTSARVSCNVELGCVDVCCQNAAHKVFRGSGRTFWSWAEALGAYKSADMQAMIRHAMDNTPTALAVTK